MVLVPQASVKPGCLGTMGFASEEVFTAAAAVWSAEPTGGASGSLGRQGRPAAKPQVEEKPGRRMLLIPQARGKPGHLGTAGLAFGEVFIAAAAVWGAVASSDARGSLERQRRAAGRQLAQLTPL